MLPLQMSICNQKIDNLDIKIHYININKEFIEDYNILVKDFCNSKDLNRLYKLICLNDRFQHLGSTILQKYIVMNSILKNKEITYLDLSINRDAKPYIKLPNSEFFDYNVSHDKDLVVIASSNKYKIGIDIMSKDKEYELENISGLFSNQSEYSINKLKLWTLIESYYKAIGIGIVYFNNRMIYFTEDKNKISIYDKRTDDLINNVIINSVEFNNYIISVCQILS
tara:strand:+ start:167 stop:841 length:675 start_codon:yes stop_codon:yes gene_type:complete